MNLQVIEAKVQSLVFTKFLRDKEIGEKERRFRVTIGTYIEFNDGWTIHGPGGRIHTGRGTVVRFNYRHGTWSVQRPQRCETNVLGYVFTLQGEPTWLKAERESGFTTLDFRRSFSPSFVGLCEAGHALAKGRPRRKASTTEKKFPRPLDSAFAEDLNVVPGEMLTQAD